MDAIPTNASKSKSSLKVDCASRKPLVLTKSCEWLELAIKRDVVTLIIRRNDHKRGRKGRPREMLAIRRSDVVKKMYWCFIVCIKLTKKTRRFRRLLWEYSLGNSTQETLNKAQIIIRYARSWTIISKMHSFSKRLSFLSFWQYPKPVWKP